MKKRLCLKDSTKTECRGYFLRKFTFQLLLKLFLSGCNLSTIIIIIITSSLDLFVRWVPHSKSEIVYEFVLFANSALFEADWFRDYDRVTCHVIQHIANFCHLVPVVEFFQKIVAQLRRLKLEVNGSYVIRAVAIYFILSEGFFIDANMYSV